MPRIDLSTVGSTGLKQFGGLVYEESLPKLQGRLGVATFREMSENDPIVGAILYTIESLFKQLQWRIEPSDESGDAARVAEFVETCMEDQSHTFEDLLSEILSMLVYGWSYFEIVYKLRRGQTNDPKTRSKFDDGRVGWRKISIRAQDTLDRWEIDQDGGIRGMWQLAPPDYNLVFIPIEKALLFRTRTNRNNPEGRSGGILRNAHRPWYFAKRLQELEAIGAERDLAGLPVMEVPIELLSPNPSNDEAAVLSQLKKLVQQVRRDEREGAIVPTELDREGNPTGYKLKLLSSGGTRSFPINDIINRYEQRIAQSVLADFIHLGMSDVGSYALASSKTKLFSVALGSVRDSILGVFNRFAIPRLCAINSIPSEFYPKMVGGDFEAPPLEEVAAYVSQLISVGAITSGPKLERKLLEYGRLPEEDE